MITSPAFADKRYAVLGLARSGKAVVRSLLASGAQVMAWDSREDIRAEFEGQVELADPVAADLTGFAGVVVSPGVPLNTHPIAYHAAQFDVPVIGDIELFAQALANLPPHKVVGITGTNGKSTTTALVHHILKGAHAPATMGGNIGLPILEQKPLPKGGIYVLELSSYQIDLTYSLDCDVVVLLNVTPDHLDRYADMDAYAKAKARLFDMQSRKHKKIFSGRDIYSNAIGKSLGGAGAHLTHTEPYTTGNPVLQGLHNADNAGAAHEVCLALGLSQSQIDNGMRTYRGLPHRMEHVEKIGGVAFVNDSKGTNTAASAPALAAFENVHWIVGGLAKDPGLGECAGQLGHVKAAYTIGKAGPDFAAFLKGRVPVEQCETLDRAVASAISCAESGDTVLLSPACASFDQYRDFEARGDHFRALVEGLK